MSFMKRHVNSFLIFAIAVAFLLLGGISYYYQGTFKEIISSYQSTKTNLKVCTTELKHWREQYVSATTTINTSKLDIVKYGQLYEETQGDLEKTKGRLKMNEAILAQTQQGLQETKKLYESEKTRTANLEDQIKNAMDQINEVEKKNDILQKDNTKLSADLAACKGG